METSCDMKHKNYMIRCSAKIFEYVITIYRMVAEQMHQHRAEPGHEQQPGRLRDLVRGFQHQAERVQHICRSVNSALLVERTLLDPISVSTTIASTFMRYSDDIE
eukprot:6486613-Amphidinium_carterae.3